MSISIIATVVICLSNPQRVHGRKGKTNKRVWSICNDLRVERLRSPHCLLDSFEFSKMKYVRAHIKDLYFNAPFTCRVCAYLRRNRQPADRSIFAQRHTVLKYASKSAYQVSATRYLRCWDMTRPLLSWEEVESRSGSNKLLRTHANAHATWTRDCPMSKHTKISIRGINCSHSCTTKYLHAFHVLLYMYLLPVFIRCVFVTGINSCTFSPPICWHTATGLIWGIWGWL